MERAEIRRLIEQGVRLGDDVWADFGSGDGAFTAALRERLGAAATIYSVERDASRLRRQRQLLQTRPHAASAGHTGGDRTNADRTNASHASTGRAGAGPAGADTGATHFIHADFTQPLDLPALDGLLMANALHYVRDPVALLTRIRGYLRPDGALLIVEYDLDRASPWVPYPLPFDRLAPLVVRAGFPAPARVATAPTRYGRGMYAALARAPR